MDTVFVAVCVYDGEIDVSAHRTKAGAEGAVLDNLDLPDGVSLSDWREERDRLWIKGGDDPPLWYNRKTEDSAVWELPIGD